MLNLPWTQTEKDNALAECRLSLRAWVSKKPMLCLHVVTDEEGHPLEDEDESGRRLCTCWCRVFEPRTENERHHETILEKVQKAPEDIQWKIDKQGFDEMIATKNESVPGPDGIPYGIYRCAGGSGSRFLFDAYQCVLEVGVVSTHFAGSRTVSIPKSSTAEDNGLIVRSPDALRPLTLCVIVTARSSAQRYASACIGMP